MWSKIDPWHKRRLSKTFKIAWHNRFLLPYIIKMFTPEWQKDSEVLSFSFIAFFNKSKTKFRGKLLYWETLILERLKQWTNWRYFLGLLLLLQWLSFLRKKNVFFITAKCFYTFGTKGLEYRITEWWQLKAEIRICNSAKYINVLFSSCLFSFLSSFQEAWMNFARELFKKNQVNKSN